MRCLTLAQALKDREIDVAFICRHHPGNLINKIKEDGFRVYELAFLVNKKVTNDKLFHAAWLGATQQQDADNCIEILGITEVDWLIVDHYALDKRWHSQLRRIAKKIMVIDDLADRVFDCDILLNQNLDSNKKIYQNKISKNCQLLLGCKYALLRPEFSKLRGEALKKRDGTKAIRNVLVSIGGVDNNNITQNILKNLNNKLNVVVVLGQNSPHNQMIQDYANNRYIKVIVGAKNMAELMLNADLAIGAGGATSWERCCLALPTILYVIAKNQKEVAQSLESVGAVKIAEDLKNDLSWILQDLDAWKDMSDIASMISDGLGVDRVVKYILE